MTAAALVVVLLGLWWWQGPSRSGPRRRPLRQQRPPRRLLLRAPQRGRVVLGRRGPFLVAAEAGHSVAVLGPTQSGKTSGLCLPAILDWRGPVLAASVKDDLLRGSGPWRSSCGPVAVIDPSGSTGWPVASWSPVDAAATYAGARRCARDLCEATRHGPLGADGDFWLQAAARHLAPLLHAAALGGGGLAVVERWVATDDLEAPLERLDAAGCIPGVLALEAARGRDLRQASSITTTVEVVLEALAEAEQPGADTVDLRALFEASGTLYLCSPAHDQRRYRGLLTAVRGAALSVAMELAQSRGGRLDPPLLVVQDEAAQLAAQEDLDVLAATGVGLGITLVTAFQDLAQLESRHGPKAGTVLGNHRARLFLAGVADPATLTLLERLGGEELVPHHQRSIGGSGATTTESTMLRPRLRREVLARLGPHDALLCYGAALPSVLRLRSVHQDSLLQRKTALMADRPRAQRWKWRGLHETPGPS